MKKYLFRTALVLAALTACNKEIDNQTPLTVDPVDETPAGKVTLTFKAAIDDATRTVYANDKTGSWEADDKITVCVTDGESFEIVDFTTEDGVTFSAEVSQDYTTIASAVYPANDEYAVFPEDFFDVTGDGDVIGLYLTNVLDIGLADDKGTLIPMVGSYDASTQTMSFHHVCGALKVTLSNIPDDATLFAFHANNQQLVFDFPLTNDGRIELGTPVEGNDDMDLFFHFTVDEETTTRSFYIPIPDGSLAAGAYVTLENEDGELLYKKVLSTAQTFNKNNIKRLPTVACWTRNEDWNAYYYGTYKTDNGSIYKGVATENVSSPYYYALINENTFNNTYGGSVIEYLSSNSFAEAVGNATPRTGDRIFGYTTFAPGIRYIIIYGLDENNKFTGEYNCVKIERPVFATPEGWSISVVEGDSYPIKYKRPSGVQWQYVTVKASTFTTYSEDVEYLIYTYARSYKNQYEEDPTKRAPLAANYNLPAPTNAEGVEYVFVSFGIDQNYLPTGDYFLLDYTFEIPTDAYSAWLGKWTVVDNGSTQNTDTWTITRKQANHSYTVKGLLGYSSDYSFEIKFNEEDGALVFPSQIYNSSTTLTYWLVGSSNKAADHQQGEYDIMQASFNENDPDKATLVGLNPLKRYYTVSYNKSDGSYNGYYKVRYLPSTMTRVTE